MCGHQEEERFLEETSSVRCWLGSPSLRACGYIVYKEQPLRCNLRHVQCTHQQFTEDVSSNGDETELKFDKHSTFSPDVESLFTNIPLTETIDYVCDLIECNGKDIGIPTSDPKKLLLLCAFNNQIYRQKDWDAMGSQQCNIQWPCRDLNPGHLTCEASVSPLLHQHTLDPFEFSRLNRRTCSHLSGVIADRTAAHIDVKNKLPAGGFDSESVANGVGTGTETQQGIENRSIIDHSKNS
ncbi:hypothetical protein T265_09238 [Opisthorchis viverrini]|uniref:Uncharacterized protein n=1 Tax=Opisthorchis viverrini TaxID=6198 RepID=A0A075A5P2_OPIVI|nr:hypothetical protein T265_09238 [Opisthorchis viverrini]KER22719.1 hypothetical protein T265_09238 [Opisthorchis viverrini]